MTTRRVDKKDFPKIITWGQWLEIHNTKTRLVQHFWNTNSGINQSMVEFIRETEEPKLAEAIDKILDNPKL